MLRTTDLSLLSSFSTILNFLNLSSFLEHSQECSDIQTEAFWGFLFIWFFFPTSLIHYIYAVILLYKKVYSKLCMIILQINGNITSLVHLFKHYKTSIQSLQGGSSSLYSCSRHKKNTQQKQYQSYKQFLACPLIQINRE